MATFVEAGITTFDCADIYTGVEELIGAFRARYPRLAARSQVHTKLVPDLSDLPTVDAALRRENRRSVAASGSAWSGWIWCNFTGGTLRFRAMSRPHWRSSELRRAGKIARIGVTNFDTPHLKELLDAGVPVLRTSAAVFACSISVPRSAMVGFCQEHGIALLCYGTVGGRLPVRALAGEAGADRAAVRIAR